MVFDSVKEMLAVNRDIWGIYIKNAICDILSFEFNTN